VTRRHALRLLGGRAAAIALGGYVVRWPAAGPAADDQWNSDNSVYEGRVITGCPEVTTRRGEVVARGIDVTGMPGSGQLIQRQHG
jgi:hypothetical protein